MKKKPHNKRRNEWKYGEKGVEQARAREGVRQGGRAEERGKRGQS